MKAWRAMVIVALAFAISACAATYSGVETWKFDRCLEDGAEMVQSADWSTAEVIDILAGNVTFTPMLIRLKPGEPYVFRFANEEAASHVFQARDFLKAVALKSVLVGDQEIGGGCITAVWIAPHGTAEIAFVAGEAGEYEFVDSNFLLEYVDAGFASGTIVVE